MIDRFEGEHAFLSNFFVEPDGTFVESEFQSAKTYDLREKLTVLAARTPGESKRLGRKVHLRSDWEQKQANGLELRVNTMTDLVAKKFWDHPKLAMMLMATKDEQLIERNHWHDCFWGVCECPKCGNQGENWLGRILMDIRALLV